MSGVMYVAVVSRMLDWVNWIPSYLRSSSSRRSIYTPKEDPTASTYTGVSTSRATSTAPIETPKNVKSSTRIAF
ncbi:hypothetical protein P3T76_002955 [Phytophthora citrophthora]|uniref:Uncharacterized protein n=1 Tax=Phytophthora citrophthora TaxID=4793 RepID=A0AAD9LSV4_9STRA|nr:hypothetical protein P3T76_002955 [Phytophthora citrophthora]